MDDDGRRHVPVGSEQGVHSHPAHEEQAEAYPGAEPYPLDVLDAGTQGMIGYLVQQELRSRLPPERQVVTLLTMIVVDPAVVPSPEPRRVLEIEPITWLLDRGAVVIYAGGGGIPMMDPSSEPGELVGAEAVIDKDFAASWSRRTWVLTCSSWPPTSTGSISTGGRRSSGAWPR